MIYKFDDSENDVVLEIEQTNEDEVQIRIEEYDADMAVGFYLNKAQVYKLIGALHLLHKEMK